jgi:glycerol-3-phosphate dehydrogenase
VEQSKKNDEIYDLLIIGGGINGAGIACDAAGRGLKTVLMESDDFASGTSSRSSKLIHGGLRYLEYYDFKLVRESLSERELLMKKARHITQPLRFVIPVVPQNRPAWLVRCGLFLYDHLAPRKSLKGTETIRLSDKPGRLGFADHLDKAFVYSDCWVDDARLVIANIQGAVADGAHVLARTKFNAAHRDGGQWEITATEQDSGRSSTLRARIIVNAAGPWAVPIAQEIPELAIDYSAKLVRGSHIVVPKIYDGPNATMLQLGDSRIVVTMPYETDYTLIGTTDEKHRGDLRKVEITKTERDYLIAAVNQFFARKITADDIVWTYAGVRPLFEEGNSRDSNPSTVTRDYSFKIDCGAGGSAPPFLTVLGGKLTTYRRLAEHVFKELEDKLPTHTGPGKTFKSLLPGADIGEGGPEAYADRLARSYPFLSEKHRTRLARTYGALVPEMLAGATAIGDLGVCFGDDLYQREVEYLVRQEWAVAADDVLWRRTKCGLRFTPEEKLKLARYLETARPGIRKDEAVS